MTSELVIVQHECADLRDGNISVRIVNFYYENGVENELTNNSTNISLGIVGLFPLFICQKSTFPYSRQTEMLTSLDFYFHWSINIIQQNYWKFLFFYRLKADVTCSIWNKNGLNCTYTFTTLYLRKYFLMQISTIF